jgi:hypothetical protein
MEVNGQRNAPATLPPVKAISYQLIRSLGRPQGHSGRSGDNQNILPPVGIRALGCPAVSVLVLVLVLVLAVLTAILAFVHTHFMIHFTDTKFSHKM